jgi:hypothetical protein
MLILEKLVALALLHDKLAPIAQSLTVTPGQQSHKTTSKGPASREMRVSMFQVSFGRLNVQRTLLACEKHCFQYQKLVYCIVVFSARAPRLQNANASTRSLERRLD